MKVTAVTSDRQGSGFYRITEPAKAATAADRDLLVDVTPTLDVELVERYQEDDDGRRLPGTTTVRPDRVRTDADVVVFQRPTDPPLLAAIDLLQAQGVAVVVEVDDLLSAVPPDHPAFAVIRSGGARVLAEACRRADLVTVSTPALAAEYARHGRVAVIPNAVPARVLDWPGPRRHRGSARIGWAGTVHSHPHDLQVVGSGLQQALDDGRATFAVLGDGAGARQRLALRDEPPTLPWVPGVESYLRALGENFDVGIAPLRLDRFNRSKSWLKPLEYAARGVLCVYTPTDEYVRLGLGRPAARPRDWARWLRLAAADPSWRAEEADRNRRAVADRHTTERTGPAWAAAWRSAADNRVRRAA